MAWDDFLCFDPKRKDYDTIPSSSGIYAIAVYGFGRLVDGFEVVESNSMDIVLHEGKRYDVVFIGETKSLRSIYVTQFLSNSFILSKFRRRLGLLLGFKLVTWKQKYSRFCKEDIERLNVWMKANAVFLYALPIDGISKDSLLQGKYLPLNKENPYTDIRRNALASDNSCVMQKVAGSVEARQTNDMVRKKSTFEKFFLKLLVVVVFALFFIILWKNSNADHSYVRPKTVVADTTDTDVGNGQDEFVASLYNAQNKEDDEADNVLVYGYNGKMISTSLNKIRKTYKLVGSYVVAPGYGEGEVLLYKKGNDYLLFEVLGDNMYRGFIMKKHKVKRNNEFVCHVLLDGFENLYHINRGDMVLLNPNVGEAYDNYNNPYTYKMIMVTYTGYVAVFMNDNSTRLGKNIYVEYLKLLENE